MSTAKRTAQDCLHERANLVVESRKILDASLGATPSRPMTGEEKSKYEEMRKRIDDLKDQHDVLMQQERVEAEMRARADEPARPAVSSAAGAPRPHEPAHRGERELPEWQQRARKFYRDAADGLRGSLRISEARGLQVDSATGGGYLVHPEHLSDLIRALDNVTYVRQRARKIRLTVSDSVDMPELTNKPSNFAWGTELSGATADTQMKYGKRTLKTNPARALIKASRKMIRLLGDEHIREEYAALVGQNEENAFWNGTGAGQPTGMMVDSGLTDYSTGNTATAVKFDGIINAIGQVKLQYRKGCEFFFPRSVMTQIKKEKDGQSRYLWNVSTVAGQPDTILGYPVQETEYISVTPAASEKCGLFGNLEQYMIADGTELEVQVLEEAFYATDEIGFKYAFELDARIRDYNAFCRIAFSA